jgi:exodeoxyribonuclease-3
MKILSRNVNGIRAVMKKGFFELMQQENPDILCLQETKAFSHQMPGEFNFLNYPHICWHAGERPGYAGTAIASRLPWHNHANTFEHSKKFHEDGRVTETEFDDFTLLNVYFPNGGTRADGTEMLTYKLAVYDELSAYIQAKQKE